MYYWTPWWLGVPRLKAFWKPRFAVDFALLLGRGLGSPQLCPDDPGGSADDSRGPRRNAAERLWAMSCWKKWKMCPFLVVKYGGIWKNMVFLKVDLRKKMRTFRGTSSKSTNSRIIKFRLQKGSVQWLSNYQRVFRYLMTAQWGDTRGPQGILSHELIDPVGFIVIFPTVTSQKIS